jgi:hypothetical protein
MPGGPPMSPVYDSYASQHILGEVPTGVAGETPYTVLARLTSGHPRYERLHAMARALADSHQDLYRVTSADGLSAELERVRGGGSLSVRLTGPFLRTGDRVLARVLPFDGAWFIADSPYLLRASEGEWLDYLARATAVGPSSSVARPAVDEKRAGPKLTPKQRARLRQSAARQKARDAAVARHLKHGASERYWLDYIMDAYAGERRGIVYLAGVPDRPETLPHHADYEPSTAGVVDDDPPTSSPDEHDTMPRLRAALIEIAEREGIVAHMERALREESDRKGLTRADVQDSERPLLTAYYTLGARSGHGLTALEHFQRERVLSPGERSLVEALERGWFSIWRIDRIHLDEALDVLDVLRRKKLRISERSATRQLALGDLLVGWVCQDESGVLTLEGGVLHVRSIMAPLVTDLARTLRDTTRQALPGADWRARAAELPPHIVLGLRVLREHAPLPELRNTSGHALQLARSRYPVRDPRLARERLGAAFEPTGHDSFTWFDAAKTVLASFELRGDALTLRVNSLERLAAAKTRLEQALGDAVAPPLDVLDGDINRELQSAAARRQPARGQPTRGPLPDLTELPPELARQVQAAILQRIIATLDQPLDMLKGKTLRQAARNAATRPDAISWLREQQRILQLNPQMSGLDMRPLWSELGLPYQGIDMDG